MKAGLEDVVVSTSEICFIDGHKGRLVYRGYDVDDLVAHSTFEEVVYLLWHGRLPSRKELDAHLKALSATANRKLPPKLLAMLRQLPKKTTPMEVLRTGVSALSAVRSRRRRQLARGDAAQVHAPDRADADAGRGVGAHPSRQGRRSPRTRSSTWPPTSST